MIVIKSGLSDLKDEIENLSEKDIEIEKPYEIVDIVERILHFNRQNQEGQGLKILTPDQILSRLPIANYTQEIIQKILKMKSGNYCIFCIVQRNYPKQSIIIRSILFKNGNNFYEH